MNILYIEDNHVNTLLMRKIIKRMNNYTLYDVESAESAFELLITFKPDIILMDLGLPGMNGIDALKTIRTNFSEFHKIPIIAVTAEAIPIKIEEALNAGFFDYITKPIDFSNFSNVLTRAAETVSQ